MGECLPQSSVPESEPDSRRFGRRLFLLIAAVLVAIDQVTKYLVVTRLLHGESVPVLGSILSFTSARNTTTAMGLVPVGGRVLVVLTAVFVLGILVWGLRAAGRSAWIGWGLSCLLGGALGNLIDRIRLNYVIDFIDVHFWPVFNVADIAIVCGAAMILIGTLVHGEGEQPVESEPDPPSAP